MPGLFKLKMNYKLDKYFDVLDYKQTFNLTDNVKKRKGFLYEFDFKSTTNDLTSDKVEYLLNAFVNFPVMGEGRKAFHLSVHFTGILSKGSTNDSFQYLKTIFGLSTKRTLKEIETCFFDLLKDVDFLDHNVLLNKRIIKNRADVPVEEYLENLNGFLETEHKEFLVKQTSFIID